jgi:hypothetical protein
MFTKFNQVLLASGLVLTSLVGFGSAAFADPGSPTGDGAMTSEEYATITYSQETTPPTVDLLDQDFIEQTLKVGVVNVKANGATGFDVKVTSTKAALLTKDGGAGGEGEQITYQLKYDDQTPIDPTVAEKQLGTEGFSTGCASSVGCDRDIKVVIPASNWTSAGVKAGTYSTSLTFTVYNK